MEVTKTLLFGDDGSLSADSAWLWINTHQWPGWSIEVLRALRDRDSDPPAPRELVHADVAEGLTIETLSADPRWALETRGMHANLIVVGCRGYGLLKSMHLGSTAEWLMHGPPAPLVIVRGGHRVRRIVLAHDGSAHADAAAATLTDFPWIATAEILIVVIAESGLDSEGVATRARARLIDAGARAEIDVRSPDELQVFYRPRDVILAAAAEYQADLIAMGSRGLTVWESVNEVAFHRAGSNASVIAQHAPCSVLLARSPSS